MQTSLLPQRKWHFLWLLPFLLSFFSTSSQAQGLTGREKSKPETVLHHKFRKNNGPASHAGTNTKTSFEKCLTMEADAYLRRKNPAIGTNSEFEQDLQKNIKVYKEKMRTSRTQALVYTIPVIVHVVHNGEAVGSGANISAAQVQTQIDVLNEDFRRKANTPGHNNHASGADIEIEFALALRDPDGNTLAEPGVHRVKGNKTSWDHTNIEEKLKPQTYWDPNKYLNLWSVKFGGDAASLLGYAQFPIKSDLPGLDISGYPTGATTDGVVINYKAFGRGGNVSTDFTGRTATHEIGHWLGLRHIWGDDNGGCKEDDYCADTPKTADKHYGCSSGTDSCTDPGKDMVENYMDYSDDACVSIFTNDQKTRMRTVLEKCPRRKDLLTSTVHIPVGGNTKPVADFTASRSIVCVGNTINFTDKSLGNVTGWKWQFFDTEGNDQGSFDGQHQDIYFNRSGSYGVQLIVSNASGKDTLSFPNYITVLPAANLDFPFTENFEGTSTLPNWEVFNPNADRDWRLSEDASSNGVGSNSAFFDNYSGDEKDNPYGTMDGLLSTKLNLATNTFAELTFDVAYARYDDNYSDSLVIYYSTDCGQTFTPFWIKAGKDLATAPDTEKNFVPTKAQWRKEKISLGFLNGKSEVYLAIVNISGWGNNVYLDNIQINVPTITQKPTAAFATTQQTVCVGSEVQFSDISGFSPRNWNWTFQGASPSTSTQQHPKVTYATPGTYSVTLTASNPTGSGTITKQTYITVVANPVLEVRANKSSICFGDSVVLSASGANNYTWFQGVDYIGKGTSITVKPTADAVFMVQGTNTTGCLGSSSLNITVTNLAKPTVTISAPADSSTVTLTSSSASGNQWFKNGEAISGATGKKYNVTDAGQYEVQVTINGCSATSDAVVLTGTKEEEPDKPAMTLYPNPATDKLTIHYPLAPGAQQVKATIYNIIGVKIEERLMEKRGDKWQLVIPVASYHRGNYVVLINDGKNQRSAIFIKQ